MYFVKHNNVDCMHIIKSNKLERRKLSFSLDIADYFTDIMGESDI